MLKAMHTCVKQNQTKVLGFLVTLLERKKSPSIIRCLIVVVVVVGGGGTLPTLEWIVAVWVRLQLVVQTLAAAEAGCGALPLWCGKSKSWCVRLSK